MKKKILVDIAYSSKIFHIIRFFMNANGYFPIFVFHRVSPFKDIATEPIDVYKFDKIIYFLSKKYQLCSIEDVCRCKFPCVITFDDATEDFYDYAMPILIKYNANTVLFIPTHAVDYGCEIWTNYILSLFSINKDKRIAINIDGNTHNFSLSEKDGILKLRNMIISLFKIPKKIRDEKIKEIDAFFAEENYIPSYKTLSWDKIKKIKLDKKIGKIIKFGSHSHMHDCLNTHEVTFIREELYKSKKLIEKELNCSPDLLAYPMGYYNKTVMSVAKEYYKFCFTTSGRLANSRKIKTNEEYRYSIPRLSVYTDNPKELFIRANGLEFLITGLRSFLCYADKLKNYFQFRNKISSN